MSFYKHHVFFCATARPEGHPKPSCGRAGSNELGKYLWEKTAEMELEGVRITSAGCLGRCDQGPVVVVYPEDVWYKVTSREDVDAIIDEHLVKGGRAQAQLID